jgi:flagellar protein FlaJ
MGNDDRSLTLNDAKNDSLADLNIDSSLLKKIKNRQKDKSKQTDFLKTSNWYARISNKFFLDNSQRLIDNGSFKPLILDLRKSNLNILSTTYLSMMFFSTFISVFIGLIIMGLLIIFSVDLLALSIKLYSGSYIARFIKLFWVPLAAPLFTFALFYIYPGAEKRAIAQRINQEIPFVVIHMASVSGSGIEPIELFKIIATTGEYKFAGTEFRKIINQTNFYGYDLSTALRNVSLSSPSTKFSELLNGMAITINSGGDMRKFFEKRADSLLLEYRLEREKANKSAETFMDLYISIVIATPMIMVMLLVIISVSRINTGFNASQMTAAIIGLVAIVNVLFITFLHIKQPDY